ncbi:flagellar hook-basal body complex protein FliE [Aquibacillus kalidii]|uniref:flagellar hook-basal body complex protein FliE n=1 Tax=Aquibacillus kalidii TaxID=2762597 RepID=UPI0016493C09|nr:flagellar hook-basal body complex protein FliE [Aquibacillus kalidii]
MEITKIGNLQTPKIGIDSINKSKITSGEAQNQFKTSLKNAIENLNKTQVASDKKTEALVTGQIDDLHDVMITAQKASIALQTAVEVQSKAINAYNEIMRMQV